jgi:hypothetical protein
VYTLSNPLISLSINKEFLSNYNVLYLLLVSLIAGMVFIGLLKRKYRLQLEEQISKKTSDKMKKLDKVYSFVFGRLFLMTVFFSMFKIIFSFCIQLSNEAAPYENFPDQLNVIAGILAFIIIFSMISFVLYWYLLLPANFSEEEEFMSIRFQNMSFYYPVVYLGYQAVFILVIAITYLQAYSAYAVLALQLLYLLAILYLRPYNTLRKFNKLFHNLTIVVNQVIAIGAVAIVMRWNSILGTAYQPSSNDELTAYCFLILVFLFLAILLALLRLLMFNKEVTFKCCKREEVDAEEVQESDYDHMKKMITEDKDKLMKNHNPDNAVNSFIKDNEKEMVPLKRKKTKNDFLFESNQLLTPVDDSKIDSFLQQNEKKIAR